ncbi:trypsin-1-like [Bacillus rossius redtenbacheri]|uniref:trypsin-1-like n=1 Tax=Bacillus rossius redtenbacheri TaxID=93214 RepID=UPI002FDCA2D0
MMKVAVALSLLVACAWGNPAPRVVGGENAVKGQNPYIVSLRRQLLFSNNHFCGGSIISGGWVLTAAHCLVANNINAVAGDYNLRVNEGTEQSVRVSKSIRHAQYVDNGSVGPFDIALLKLASSFTFNQYVQPINLPAAGKIHTGETVLAGWGSISLTMVPSNPAILQSATLPVLPYSSCYSAVTGISQAQGIANPLDPSNVCSGPLSGGLGACNGDSGGPLAQKNAGAWELVGVVSWGLVPCGSAGAPSVYVRASAFIDWIAANTA